MKVIISRKAQSNLHEIVEYHRQKGYLKFGRKIRARIISKIMRLKDFPKMGQEEENLKELNLGHRYLIENNYKILYRIIEDKVLVTHIFDTRQDPEKM
jgi:toxin ParE1/3/4